MMRYLLPVPIPPCKVEGVGQKAVITWVFHNLSRVKVVEMLLEKNKYRHFLILLQLISIIHHFHSPTLIFNHRPEHWL